MDVVFTAEGNLQPSLELIQKVQDVISAKRPVATDCLVRAPSEVSLNVAVNAVFYPHYTPNKSAIEAAVYAYFGALSIGRDFEPSQLSAPIQALEGVKSVSVI